MSRRLTAALITATLAIGLTVAAPHAAATSTTHTLAQTEAALNGVSVGPNANTYYGQATINGTWTSYLDCHNHKHYVPKLTMSNHNPTIASAPPVTATRHATPTAICTPDFAAQPVGPVQADSWYNPSTWNWAKIWGSLWNTISKCINGAANGVISNMTVIAAAIAITGGADLLLTPEGLVVIALGSCIAKIGW